MIWAVTVTVLGVCILFATWCEHRTAVARAKHRNTGTVYIYCCEHGTQPAHPIQETEQ